jgi:hypothetical protein
MGAETVTYRLRRAVWGYRRDDVVAALTTQHREIEGLAESLERQWRERTELADELVRTAAAHETALTQERRRGDRAEAGRRVLTARLAAEADRQATLLRLVAGASEGRAITRVEELLGVRERLLGELHGILDSHASLLRRLTVADGLERVPDLDDFERVVSRFAGERRVEIRELETTPGEVALTLARAAS